jgi:hypothetical protein
MRGYRPGPSSQCARNPLIVHASPRPGGQKIFSGGNENFSCKAAVNSILQENIISTRTEETLWTVNDLEDISPRRSPGRIINSPGR